MAVQDNGKKEFREHNPRVHFWCGLVFGLVVGAIVGGELWNSLLADAATSLAVGIGLALAAGRSGDAVWRCVLEWLSWF